MTTRSEALRLARECLVRATDLLESVAAEEAAPAVRPTPDRATDGPVYLTSAELADRFRTSASTVRQWRHVGTGPKGTRFGKRVLYRLDDVEAWESTQWGAERRAEGRLRHEL